MNDLLNLGVHSAHLLVKLGVVAPHDLGIPTGSNKDRLDTARNRGGEDVGDLEADKERERHDDCCVLTVAIVRGVGEVEIEVGQETASVRDEEAAERKDGSDEAVLPKLEACLKIKAIVLTLIRASIPRSLIIFHVSLAAAK